MSLRAVTVGADTSVVVDAVRAVGWYGVDVCHRLACSGGCYDALSSVDAVDACCDTCGLRPVVEVSLCAQPGMVDRDVSACVDEGDVLVFEDDPRAAPVLFAVSRPMWEGFWRARVGGVSLWWRLGRVVASVGVWRLLRWRLVSCCVVAAREWRSRTATTRDW